MNAKLHLILDKTAINSLFLRFFIKNLHFFLLFQKKALPLHPQNEICTFAEGNVIGVWCNGNTADSGPAFPGSSPGTPTREESLTTEFSCLAILFYHIKTMNKETKFDLKRAMQKKT